MTLLNGDTSHSLEVLSDAKDLRRRTQALFGQRLLFVRRGGDDRIIAAIQISVAIALRSKSCWKTCSSYRPQSGHLLHFWQMDLLWPGVILSSGGDSSTVQNQLQYLQQVDSCEVEDQLQNMQEAQATQQEACAAIAADGSVATWGDQDSASDSFKLEVWLRLGDCSSCTAEHGCAKKVAHGSGTYRHSMQLLCPVWGRGWTPEQGQWQVGFMVDMASVIRLSDMVLLAPSQICCSRDRPSWIHRILIVG